MQQAEQECRAAGCSGFMTKPINFDRLITTLAEIAGIEVSTAPQVSTVSINDPLGVADLDTASAAIISTLPLHKERFRAIVEQFTQTLDERFDALEVAFKAGDCQTLLELSHSLKGASGNCGFAVLADVAAELEQTARINELDCIPDMLGQLRNIQSRIRTPKAVAS